jgi:ribonuclease-3
MNRSVKPLQELETAINLEFKNKELLKTALTHSSYKACYKRSDIQDNEKLEFLGDAVLNLCISLYLYQKYPDDSEGELTKKRAYLVCKETLIKVAKKLGLLDFIYLGRRERRLDLKSKQNISARTVEALIGAIFLEFGLEIACERVRKWFSPYLRGRKEDFKDYKTRLQELSQRYYGTRPEYQVVKVLGPAHNPKFEVEVRIEGKVLARARGKSKKEAENLAAKKALISLKKEEEGLILSLSEKTT